MENYRTYLCKVLFLKYTNQTVQVSHTRGFSVFLPFERAQYPILPFQKPSEQEYIHVSIRVLFLQVKHHQEEDLPLRDENIVDLLR